MFIPEYTITPKTLNNISNIEYNRAIINSTNILPNFKAKLEKESLVSIIHHSLGFNGKNLSEEVVKMFLDGVEKEPINEIINLVDGYQKVRELALTHEFDESDIKVIHRELAKNITAKTKVATYRSKKLENRTDPQEILAETTELFDWFNSLDSRDSNPIIVAGIIKGRLSTIEPFEFDSFTFSNFVSNAVFLSRDYHYINYICLEEFYNKSKKEYYQQIDRLEDEDNDFTAWLEYYTDGVSAQTANAEQKVKLLAKDSKLAKVTGRVYLSERQERIIEYLQDYNVLRNKQFPILFPSISEDTVLRDLKKLVELGLVVKRGSTKSSRYELK